MEGRQLSLFELTLEQWLRSQFILVVRANGRPVTGERVVPTDLNMLKDEWESRVVPRVRRKSVPTGGGFSLECQLGQLNALNS